MQDPALRTAYGRFVALLEVRSVLGLDPADLDEVARTELLLIRATACRFGIDLALRVADRMA